MAFHPLGTARADARPGHGVRRRRRWRVHGVRRRPRARRRVVPSALGVNPQITIMALGHAGSRSPCSARRRRTSPRPSAWPCPGRRRLRQYPLARDGDPGSGAQRAHLRAVRPRRRRRRHHRRRRGAGRGQRGFAVALVERRDYAAGTSSPLEQARPRRAALPAELRPRARARGAAGAPAAGQRWRRTWCARCRFVVPASRAARPDRLSGMGLNMYDVMARRRCGAAAARGDGEEDDWSPDRHRMIDGDEVVELMPALAPRDPSRGYLFYDCQTDDARLVLTVLAEAERFGAVCANRLRGHRAGRPTACAACRARRRDRRGRFDPRRQRDQRHRRVGRPHAGPRSSTTRPRCRSSGRAAGTHITLSPRRAAACDAGAIVPAGGGRTIFAAALARAHADRHHRQRLRGRRSTTCRPPRTTSPTCSTPSTRSSA